MQKFFTNPPPAKAGVPLYQGGVLQHIPPLDKEGVGGDLSTKIFLPDSFMPQGGRISPMKSGCGFVKRNIKSNHLIFYIQIIWIFHLFINKNYEKKYF